MKKRIFRHALLAISMVSLVLAGCQSNRTDSGEDGSSGKTKLTAIIVKHSLTKDVNQMKWLKDLEDKANVEIEWQQITADWDQKKAHYLPAGKFRIYCSMQQPTVISYNSTDYLKI